MTRTEPPPGLVEAISSVVGEAMAMYSETHTLAPQDEDEVCRDFTRFYISALAVGLTGIRWNFNGCILCGDDPRLPQLLRRILILDPRVTSATGGRGFGTLVCVQHAPLITRKEMPQAVLDGALRRIRRDPPKPGARP